MSLEDIADQLMNQKTKNVTYRSNVTLGGVDMHITEGPIQIGSDGRTSGPYEQAGSKIGKLVEEKNKAYGSAFDKAGNFLRLIYPNGIKPGDYTDMLAIVRNDIAGYAILAQVNKEKELG